MDQIKKNSYSENTKKAAWEEIYAAEGSDWFWWLVSQIILLMMQFSISSLDYV